MTNAPQTLYDTLWAAHVVRAWGGGMALLYVDRQPIGEVLSPKAFEGVRTALGGVRRPAAELAVADHAAGRP